MLFFGPALTFCWAKKQSTHSTHTQLPPALIPRQRYFVPIPKQTRLHISLHYLNVNRQGIGLNRAFFLSGYQKRPSQAFKTRSNEIIQKINKKLHLFSFRRWPPFLFSFSFFWNWITFFPGPWECGTTVEELFNPSSWTRWHLYSWGLKIWGFPLQKSHKSMLIIMDALRCNAICRKDQQIFAF